jgi:hypothetical protein
MIGGWRDGPNRIADQNIMAQAPTERDHRVRPNEFAAYLEALAQGGKSWKPKFFLIRDNFLMFFKTESDKKPEGVIPLEEAKVSAFSISLLFIFFFFFFNVFIFITLSPSFVCSDCPGAGLRAVLRGHHVVAPLPFARADRGGHSDLAAEDPRRGRAHH